MTWWEWAVVICLAVGALWCFANAVDLWRHRGHVGTVLREAAGAKRASDKNAMSASWLRVNGYGKDGDKVA